MKSLHYLLLCLTATSAPVLGQPELKYQSSIIEVDSSIRAIEAVNDRYTWFAGSNGYYGYTKNSGLDWTVKQMSQYDVPPHFRGVAVTKKAVLLLEITKPARIHRSIDEGDTWRVVYTGESETSFYDAIKFDHHGNGFVFGDPDGGCITLLISNDYGLNWKRIPCERLPQVKEGEGGFAASNTNIDILGDQVWVATGGKVSRVYHSDDLGLSWSVSETPITSGHSMTGIFSMDINEFGTGFSIGGNWEEQLNNSSNKLVLNNNQNDWILRSPNAGPGYSSCVKFFPESNDEIIAVGPRGVNYSMDQGHHWFNVSNDAWYAVSIAPSGRLFLAGRNKLATAILKN